MECLTNLQWSESARLTVYDDHGASSLPTNHLPREFFRTLPLAVAGSRCAIALFSELMWRRQLGVELERPPF